MRKIINSISLAGIALALDILAFALLSCIIYATTNIFLTLALGMMLYVFSWDAFQASTYLINHFKK